MSDLTFKNLNFELDDLVSFMTSNHWIYHSNPHPSIDEIESRFHKGWYSTNKETFWIEKDSKKIGLLIVHDMDDTILSFDIRIDAKVRGNGYATIAMHWLINYVFNLQDKKIRLEAYTRSDNLAMRKTLHKCGFVKEGYLRDAWENDDGSVADSICYALIRKDWEHKQVTPIKLNDLPY
ncbi:GNAT family N-acetyltransferase [Robertmurraya massiliosenegalensis]|uniref:GNAT family N-acetyltransferase n=1 Tax=Robertmurraya massiliosenegalensis TaxID=1287657 RepID=UPI0002D29EDB|nr:GNAT family protein [Robertmurraya massiliosenegalensis]